MNTEQKIITNRITANSTFDIFMKLAQNSNKIVIAVSFLGDIKIVDEMLSHDKKIHITVSLRPPTNFYTLKELMIRENVEISYLGDDFHSKIFSFYNDKDELTSSIIGSSNFTNNGFRSNIETNVVITDEEQLKQIHQTHEELAKIAKPLEYDVLRKYKNRYDDFAKYKETDKNTVKTILPLRKSKQQIKYGERTEEHFLLVITMDKKGYKKTEIAQDLCTKHGYDLKKATNLIGQISSVMHGFKGTSRKPNGIVSQYTQYLMGNIKIEPIGDQGSINFIKKVLPLIMQVYAIE